MNRAALVVVVAGLLCFACSTTKPADLRVRAEYTKSVNWSEMKAFRMASSSPGQTTYTRYRTLEQTVSRSLIEELTGRGYERVENGTTDFRVAFDLIFRGDKTPTTSPDPYGADTTPATTTGAGQVSTLIIKMLDPNTSQILWQGTVSGFTVDAIRPEAGLRKAVWRVLAEFPPITG
jgi:hypothetical protein